MQLVLWQQGAQLFDDGVQLVLVAQPPAAEELLIDSHGCADEPQLLGAHPGADLHVPASDEERVKGAVGLVQLRRVGKVVDDYKHLVEFLHFQLLGRLGDLTLPLDDAPQRRLVPLVPVGLLFLRVHPKVLLDVLLDGDPAVVDVYAGAEDEYFLKDAAILLQNHADQRDSLARFGRPEEDARAWHQGHHGVRGLLTAILCRRKQLDLTNSSFCLTSQIRSREAGRRDWERCGIYSITPIKLKAGMRLKYMAGKPGGETGRYAVFTASLSEFSGIKLKAGIRLKYMGSKAWLAPHLDRLLGDVPESWSTTSPPGARPWRCVVSTPLSHRCYLRRDPVFLRSLLRLVGRKVDRRFYFRQLLSGAQRGRAGRRAACSYTLLRNSFSGKWGSFTQQRPLALSSVRCLQRPPTNVTVRHQDALAYLRALPCLAPRQCIYADPPYIFPGRTMNYYGTRRRGHDLAFHSELRDTLFASGLPFVLSINNVPEAWELYGPTPL